MPKTLPLTDLQRGMIAGQRFEAVQEFADGWMALPKLGGEWLWIVDPVTAAYLDGLQAVGCIVIPLEVRPRIAA